MDGQNAVLLFILEWVWIPIGTAVVWNFLKTHKLDKKCATDDAEGRLTLAVFDEKQQALTNGLKNIDKRNEAAHTKIETKLDKHNDRVLKRIDSLTTLVRNGK